MDVLYVSNSVIPSRMANSIHSMKMCQALARLGHTVTLVARQSKLKCENDYEYYGVEAIFDIVKLLWPKMPFGGLIYGWQTARLIWARRRTYDLIYGRSVYGVYAGAIMGLASVYEVHAPPGNVARRFLEARLLRSKSLKGLVVISEALRREYMRLFPWLDTACVIVAHDGADDPRSSMQPYRLLGRPGAMQIGYVGHLYRGKGAEIVLRVAEHLPEMDFHLVGGEEQDIEYWKSKTSLSNVYFHGFVSPSQVYQFYGAFDVLLLPCGYTVAVAGNKGDIAPWMSPIKMFEYMASGKPIVASDLPVIREVLVDGVNSILVQPENIDAWVSALKRLKQDHALAMRLGTMAQRELLKKYTWTQRAARILASVTL